MSGFHYQAHSANAMLNDADRILLRTATPPSDKVVMTSFEEDFACRTDVALRPPHDADPPNRHVEFLDAHLELGRKIYQTARDFFYKDVVIFRSEGHLQARAMEDWLMEMQDTIRHLEFILEHDFIPYANGQLVVQPFDYYFYLAFRWHYVKPQDSLTCIRVVRVIKRYITDKFYFEEGQKQKELRHRMTRLIEAGRRSQYYREAPHLASNARRWRHIVHPVPSSPWMPPLIRGTHAPIIRGQQVVNDDLPPDDNYRRSSFDVASELGPEDNGPQGAAGGKGELISARKKDGQMDQKEKSLARFLSRL
jgi:hypothetical protein